MPYEKNNKEIQESKVKGFKMKGSPMKRNFGIGVDSPMKQGDTTTPTYSGVGFDPMSSYDYKDSSDIPSFRDMVSLEQQQAYADKVDKRRDSRRQTKDMRKDFKETRKDFRAGNKEEIQDLKDSGASREEIRSAKKLNRTEQRDLRRSHRDDIRTERKSIEEGNQESSSGDDWDYNEGEDNTETTKTPNKFPGTNGTDFANQSDIMSKKLNLTMPSKYVKPKTNIQGSLS